MNDIDTLNNIEAQDEDGNKDLLLRNSRNRGIKKLMVKTDFLNFLQFI